jgi:predicted permease
VPPAEARRLALAEIGGMERVKESVRTGRHGARLDEIGRDVRYAVRTLIRAPGFSSVAILTLAIGILGTTTIFSGVNALLFTPLPAERPEQIVQVVPAREPGGKHPRRLYEALREHNTSFTALAAVRDVTVSLSDSAEAARAGRHAGMLRGEVVSGNYFEMLGVHAAQGRAIAPDDDRPAAAAPVVAISDTLWRTRFGADPQALGRVIYLNGNPFAIVGIVPPAFTGTVFANETDFWAPVMVEAQLAEVGPRPVVVHCMGTPGRLEECGPGRLAGDFRVLGRLKPGVTPDAASAQLTAIAANVPDRVAVPPTLQVVAELQARHENHLPQVQRIATLALGVSGLVWLIACGNVANLFLTRATVRRREIAIRLAMGAGRWRVVRQLLAESTVLALLAGTLAVVLTFWTARLLGTAIPANVQLPIALDFTPDLRVFAWALALSFATGVAFGCAPAWQAVRTSVVPSLKPGEGGSSQGARRLTVRNALVVAQLSVSVVVLLASGLFVRSLQDARDAFKPAFDASRLLSMRLEPGVLGYKAPRIEAAYQEVLRQLKNVPRIESASLAGSPPFGGHGNAEAHVVPEEAPADASRQDVAGLNHVGPHYLRAMGIPIAAGRDFDERDTAGAAQVAILSDALARRVFGAPQAAIGRRVRADEDGTATRLEIVGVAGDKTPGGASGHDEPILYVPSLQRQPLRAMTLVVRAASPRDLASLEDAVRRAIGRADAAIPTSEVRTGEDHAERQLGALRLTAEVSMLLGVVALTLAGLGLYGVIAYSVSTRAREIGIRMALGAHPTNVRRLIIAHGLTLTAIGLVIGLGSSLLLAPALQSILVDLPAIDATTAAAVSLALTAIALVACYLPARRASRIDPIATLRTE